MLTRRDILKALAAFGVTGTAFGGYALAEPFRDIVTGYSLTPAGWPPNLKLRVAVIADLHACDPWMSVQRIEELVAQTNSLKPDVTLLLGDFVAGYGITRFGTRVPNSEWATALAGLKAPLGVHAVLGNHDWWEDPEVQKRRKGPVPAGLALEAAGIPVYENKAVRLIKDGKSFWLAGLGDQWAFWPKPHEYQQFKSRGKKDYTGIHDVAGTLAQVTDDAPVILMAHEPDIFQQIPARVALTISGHTHGGQIRLFGYSPVVPSRYRNRYAYGHIIEDDRNLIVSAGLGLSMYPIRFGAPPEIVVIELGGGVAA